MKTIILSLLFLISSCLREIKTNEEEKNHYSSFLQAPLNAGLPITLRKFVKEKDSLFLIIHRPKYSLDYSSPSSLRDSILKNGINQINVGHVQLAWKCTINGKTLQSAFGFTGELSSQFSQLIKDGYGATALFAIFNDGFIEEPMLVDQSIQKSIPKKLLTILRIDPGTKCGEVLKNLFPFLTSQNINSKFSLIKVQDTVTEAHSCSSVILDSLKPLPIYKKLRMYSAKSIRISQKYMGFNSRTITPPGTSFPKFIPKIERQISPSIDLPNKWEADGISALMYDPESMIRILNEEGADQVL